MDARRTALILMLSPLTAAPLGAQQQAQACQAEEHRQFDFWLGDWRVHTPDGKEAGTSRITRVSNGCAVLEEWRSAAGPPGVSINFYDARSRTWNQHWVGGGGMILHLAGALRDGAMVLSGERDTPSGRIADRIRWERQPDGAVTQTWETSSDGGRTWTTAFVGRYARAG
jgi:hypothetical protein